MTASPPRTRTSPPEDKGTPYRGRYLRILGIGFFLFILWMPSLDMLAPFLPSPQNSEKRALMQRPKPTWRTLGDFPKSFERYFNDHFGGRSLLIRWNNYLSIKWLGESPLKSILLGKEGWLFYTLDKEMADHQGLVHFSKEELETIRQNIGRQARRLRELGIPYCILVCPDKESIYPEYLPKGFAPAATVTRLDQILGHLGPEERKVILDVREPLRESKKQYPVYSRTDTHWNSFGAFTAYQKLMESFSASLPGMRPLPLSDFSLSVKTTNGQGDLAEMACLAGWLQDQEVRMIPKTQSLGVGKKISKAVIFHDSFIHTLKPFLEPHFDRIIFQHWGKQFFDFQVIERERPTLVVFEIGERYSPVLGKDNGKP
jgi:alginate O-acetyltransferase complex protein AlgJ